MSASNWVRRFHPARSGRLGPPRLRLLCLPHAGGSATFFFPLSAGLHPETEVLAVQYPGRQDRRKEPALRSIEDLAYAVTAEIADEGAAPLALFGHSTGAILAFETTRRLEARGSLP